MNSQLAKNLIEELLKKGVNEFCVCPGARNAPLIYALSRLNNIKIYHWFEERSAAFFAIGLSRASHYRPVAIITTSGTAAGELLPASMEAYYTGVPLLLVTADRPRTFRSSGAPQSAEQVGLFGLYAPFSIDIDFNDKVNLETWSCQSPAHINVCFEEPEEEKIHNPKSLLESQNLLIPTKIFQAFESFSISDQQFSEFAQFIQKSKYPLVIVGALSSSSKESVIQFLDHLNVPVYAEAVSGLREDPRLDRLRISCIDKAWKLSAMNNYPIDAVFRLGGVPTARLWRDLEEKKGSIAVCSVSEHPFSGLSWCGLIYGSIDQFCRHSINQTHLDRPQNDCWKKWQITDQQYYRNVLQLIDDEPTAEISLVHKLSKIIPYRSKVYLGNSQPIREWDLAATYDDHQFQIGASRGLNGIDGQISTFLGWSTGTQSNWAILGDLTALYDMAGPWIISQLLATQIKIVVINNRGGKIFAQKFSNPAFYNEHTFDFSHFASFWRLPYERWTEIPKNPPSKQAELIEIAPDEEASNRFWDKFSRL